MRTASTAPPPSKPHMGMAPRLPPIPPMFTPPPSRHFNSHNRFRLVRGWTTGQFVTNLLLKSCLPFLLLLVSRDRQKFRIRSFLLQAPSPAARRPGRATAVEVRLPAAGLAPAVSQVPPGDAAQGLVGNAEVSWQQTHDKLASGSGWPMEVMSERFGEIFTKPCHSTLVSGFWLLSGSRVSGYSSHPLSFFEIWHQGTRARD